MRVRDGKGILTNYGEGSGGYKKGAAAQVKFYPCEKGGRGRKSCSHAEGRWGQKKIWVSFFSGSLKF